MVLVNEDIDLLYFRMLILNPVVDFFIIGESNITVSGLPKHFYFEGNISQFDAFEDKIIHVKIADHAGYDGVDGGDGGSDNVSRSRERHQRNALVRGLDEINRIRPTDIVLHSDVDEIPDPTTIKFIKAQNWVCGISCFKMDVYLYNLENFMYRGWRKAKVLRAGILIPKASLTLDDIRQYSWCDALLDHGGWYLSYFGGVTFIQNKLRDSCHEEYNKSEYTNSEHVKAAIESGTAVYDKDKHATYIPLNANSYLPPDYQTLLSLMHQSPQQSFHTGKEGRKD